MAFAREAQDQERPPDPGRSNAMRTVTPLLASLAASLVTLAAPCPASACWDGYAANVRRVHVSVDTGEGAPPWTPELVRDVASWLVRVDALLPAGATVDVGPWRDGTVCGADAADGSCARAWNDCAHVVDARARDGKPLHRVLVGAFLDEAEARAALAAIVTHTSLRGFVRTLRAGQIELQ